MKILTSLPYVALVPMAVLMALVPFSATPHLIEKWRMAFAGTLHGHSTGSISFCTPHLCCFLS